MHLLLCIQGDHMVAISRKLCSAGGAHGWNIDIDAVKSSVLLVQPPSGVRNRGSVWRRCCARCWVLRDRAAASFSGCGWIWIFWTSFLIVLGLWMGVGYRPYFENYTVDASILDRNRSSGFGSTRICLWYQCSPRSLLSGMRIGLCCSILIVKFLRANGECLGIWSRRRTYKSAISLGELIIEL